MWQFFSATTSKAATGWKHHSLKSSCPSLATMTLNNPTSLSESAVKQNERWKALGQNNVVHHRLFLASALRDFHPHHIQSHFQTILYWFKISEGFFYFGRKRQVKRLLARSRGWAQRACRLLYILKQVKTALTCCPIDIDKVAVPVSCGHQLGGGPDRPGCRSWLTRITTGAPPTPSTPSKLNWNTTNTRYM